MAENIVARDLMLQNFAKTRDTDTLHDAMRALLRAQSQPETPNAVVVVAADGRYLGVVTAHLLFKSLLALWIPGKAVRADEVLLEKELLDVVVARSRVKICDAMVRGLPAATPDDRLLDLIELACDQRMEFIPVVADGQILGLVPVTKIFHAASALALTPEHEGIRMDGKAFT